MALAAASLARADVLIGDFSGGDSSIAHPILRFTDTANGNVAPIGGFDTDLPGERMQTPFSLTYDADENVVYVADFYGEAIRVYAENANGNTAPLRTLNPPFGQPRQVAVSTEHDELITEVYGCCIASYPRTASGSNVASLRMIQWGGLSGSVTRLNHPSGPALRKSSDTLIVADFNASAAVLLTFARTADGNAAPLSSIEGNLTKLGSGATAPVYDEAHDEIIVVGIDNTTSTSRILTFAGTASGNVAPLRSIEGPAANLSGVTGVAYDPAAETIYITEGGYNSIAPYVLAFPRTADGNVAPSRVIAGGNTQLGYPAGIAVTVSHIFKNGFE